MNNKKKMIMSSLLYVALTYMITWVLWAFYFRGYGAFRILGSFVPSVVGILFAKKNDLKAKIFRFQMPWYIAVFIIGYTFLGIFIPYVITHFFANSTMIFHVEKNVMGFNVSQPQIAILYFTAILVVGGPLGEEIGWRGYLLPQLEQVMTPLAAGIVVGIVWTGWHLPMFIFHISGYNIPLLLYLLQTINFSIIFTWLYHKTNHSIGAVILFHTIDNFVNSIFFQKELSSFNSYSICYLMIQLVIAVCMIVGLLKINKERNKTWNIGK